MKTLKASMIVLSLALSLSSQAATSVEATYIESQKKIYQLSQKSTEQESFDVFYYSEMKAQLIDLQEMHKNTPRWMMARKTMLETEIEKTQEKIAMSEKELVDGGRKEIVRELQIKDDALAELLKTEQKSNVSKAIIEKVPASDQKFLKFVSKGLEEDIQRHETYTK